MATTRIMPLHVGKGRTESRAISDIIDYVANPKKTDNGRLITGYGCDSRTCLLYTSYSQVYSWVRKYDITGEDGLSDKRGRHKTDDEVDELERLRRENMRLKHQLEEKDMVVELLKKVKEFEGM